MPSYLILFSHKDHGSITLDLIHMPSVLFLSVVVMPSKRCVEYILFINKDIFV